MKTENRYEPVVDEVVEYAPAKVNLTLSVGSCRRDGYHDLVSLMETVSLFDRLTVRVENKVLPEIKLHISGTIPVPKDPSNLVVRAAEAYFARSNARFSISVSLEKNVPTEAGLGGGSADAAAMLRALNRLSDHPLSQSDLTSVAAGIGADVAFCLCGGTAICRGIGDRVEPIDDPAHRFYVVVMGDDRVSTSHAYRALDLQRETNGVTAPGSNGADLYAIAHGVNVRLFNDFESVVFPDHPGIARMKDRLLSLGATSALMTGSGAAVFGLFPDAGSASSAAAKISDADAFTVESVGRYYS